MRTRGWSATGSSSSIMSARGQLAAQMQEVLRLQQPGIAPARPGRARRRGRSGRGSLSKPRSPRQSASSTVVTPAAAHCASCASMADRDGQRALRGAAPAVRDCRCGRRQRRASGSRRRGPIAPRHVAAAALHVADRGRRRSTTVPVDDLARQHEAGVGQDGSVMRRPAAARRRTSRSAIGVAHLGVMEDADDARCRAPSRLAISAMTTSRLSASRRGGGLVEQQDRMAGDEAARQVDPLLLAAREGGRRQRHAAGAGCSAAAAAPRRRARACSAGGRAPSRPRRRCRAPARAG